MVSEKDFDRWAELVLEIPVVEKKIKKQKKILKNLLDELVQLCPHTTGVSYKPEMRGMGANVFCMVCGLTDYCSYGSTQGDEYDYGYPGRPHPEFWRTRNIITMSRSEAWAYSKGHEWYVNSNGKVAKKFA